MQSFFPGGANMKSAILTQKSNFIRLRGCLKIEKLQSKSKNITINLLKNMAEYNYFSH